MAMGQANLLPERVVYGPMAHVIDESRQFIHHSEP
jgi:hypothetical protein